MRTSKTNNKKSQAKHGKNRSISCEKISSKAFEDNFFKNINMDMKIKDDFIDPMDNMLGFDNFEDKMFNHFRNDFGLLLDEEKEKEDKVAKRNNNKKNKKINNGTYFSKVYCSSYNNVNGKKDMKKNNSLKILIKSIMDTIYLNAKRHIKILMVSANQHIKEAQIKKEKD